MLPLPPRAFTPFGVLHAAMLASIAVAAWGWVAGARGAGDLRRRHVEEMVAVGQKPDREAPVRRSRPVAPGLQDLAERLSDRLETRVKVDLGQRKGRITVEFASLEDLRRIVDIMDPRNRTDRPI